MNQIENQTAIVTSAGSLFGGGRGVPLPYETREIGMLGTGIPVPKLLKKLQK